MAEYECHNLAQPGDVLVIQGVPHVSNLGGMSSQVGKRQGEVGAIVEGGVRDIGHSRSIDFPVWSTDISPATGKWRLEAAEINGPVVICGVKVSPGDLVVADDTGVCFIPRERIVEVLEGSEKKSKTEEARCKEIDEGMPVTEIVRPASTHK
jgi:4-hydroxy-4-methyl-2-oxoglutarate aldolase